jgi:hypothetical protein
MCALRGERLGDAATDIWAGSGYYGNFVTKSHGYALVSSAEKSQNSKALAESNSYASEARNLRFVCFAGLSTYHWTEGAGKNHIAGPQVLAFVSELSC